MMLLIHVIIYKKIVMVDGYLVIHHVLQVILVHYVNHVIYMVKEEINIVLVLNINVDNVHKQKEQIKLQ